MIDACTMSDTSTNNHSVCIKQSGCITHSECINHSGYFTQCMYQSEVSIIVYVSTWYIWLIYTLWLIHLIHKYTMIDTPYWYIHYDSYPWLMHTLWLKHLIDTISIIVYVSIRCVSHNVCINQVCQSYCMYQSGVLIIVCVSIRCIHYDCYNWLIHTLWLIHLIDTYFMIDTSDWYINYDWYKFMYQSGVSVIVYVSIRCVSDSVCMNQVCQS
jgi:hypothetical protein